MSTICLTWSMGRTRVGKDEELTAKGRKVVARLKEIGQNRNWLARKLSVNKQTLGNWLKSDDIQPQLNDDWEHPDAWQEIARHLDIEAKRLTDNRLELKPSDKPQGVAKIDDSAPLGLFRLPIPELEVELPRWPALPCNEDWEYEPNDLEETLPVPVMFARRNGSAPLRIVAPVHGTSMEPTLREGDLVVVELDRTPRTGRIILARSERGKTLKVLMRDRNGAFRLDPINGLHGSATAEIWEQEGFVIGILKNYRSGRGSIEWDFGGIGP